MRRSRADMPSCAKFSVGVLLSCAFLLFPLTGCVTNGQKPSTSQGGGSSGSSGNAGTSYAAANQQAASDTSWHGDARNFGKTTAGNSCTLRMPTVYMFGDSFSIANITKKNEFPLHPVLHTGQYEDGSTKGVAYIKDVSWSGTCPSGSASGLGHLAFARQETVRRETAGRRVLVVFPVSRNPAFMAGFFVRASAFPNVERQAPIDFRPIHAQPFSHEPRHNLRHSHPSRPPSLPAIGFARPGRRGDFGGRRVVHPSRRATPRRWPEDGSASPQLPRARRRVESRLVASRRTARSHCPGGYCSRIGGRHLEKPGRFHLTARIAPALPSLLS